MAVIEVEGLTKSFGDNHAVRGLTFSVAEGEVLAVLGPNGAGKTTTVEILEGYQERDGGSASVLGMDPATGGSELRQRIGIVLQETGVEPATSGLADVRTLRPRRGEPMAFGGRDGELVFGFVLDGSAMLDYRSLSEVDSADAFVIPPGQPWRLTHPSPDFRLLHVTTAPLD